MGDLGKGEGTVKLRAACDSLKDAVEKMENRFTKTILCLLTLSNAAE